MVVPVFLAGCLLFSCQGAPAPQTDSDALPSPDTIRLNPVSAEGAATFEVTGGTVFWQGKKSIGDPHNGTIAISGGALQVNQGRLLGGAVTLDMRSITVTNLNDPGEKADLVSHLKDKDFFDVGKYPEAQFEISELLPSNLPAFNWVLRGMLTIKGKSSPVNVPVKMTISGDSLEAESATFIINRTLWGLNFRSGALGTAKDKIIEDVVPLSLKISAKKKA